MAVRGKSPSYPVTTVSDSRLTIPAMAESKQPSLLSWIVAGVLAVPVLYVLSDGPAMYAVKRRWITMDAFLAVWGPLPECVGEKTVDAYEAWWCELAYGHGGSD